jgi:4-amino-4-deoxy-L-arabinose transferase-like glycosyltransferase
VTVTSTQPGAARPARHSRFSKEWLLRARPGDPAWARPALLALLVATALLYIAGLSRNGWANEFYAAAVQAGTKSWKAFFFGSVDSSNFITVDKTPASLWVMELSARIFGLNSWSLLVPQAVEGVATVGVLYTTVRRWFGPTAAIIAGTVLALSPVATLMFRFDNPDALLALVMTLAAYATTRAIESGRTRWLVLAGALLGLGYLTKMLQAFLVLPAFALAYLWAGQAKLGRRLWQLVAGGGALLAAAGWWIAVDALTPAADRPYVGGSTDNSILQLTFGYNGFGRITGNESGFGTGTGLGSGLGHGLTDAGPSGRGFGGATGITRLFQADMGGQITWLLPAALIGLAVMLWVSRRAARTDRTRAAALLWGGWLLTTGMVFSYMSGIIHPYYTTALAPAIGALVGIGATELWRIRRTWFARAVLAAALVVTGSWAWILLDRSPGWFPWLRVVIVIAAAGAVAVILAGPAVRARIVRGRAVLAAAPVSLALVAGLGGPLAYSVDTVATSQTGAIPSAGPTVAGSSGGPGSAAGKSPAGKFPVGEFPGGADIRPGGKLKLSPGEIGGAFGGNASVSHALTRLLETGASGYRWAAATISSTSAASLELSSDGVPVMAIGGFTGSDPAPSLAEFEKFVSAHEIHYFVSGGLGGGLGGLGLPGGTSGRSDATAREATKDGTGGFAVPGSAGGGSDDASQITSWVEAHFTAETVGGTTVYDLTSPKTASRSAPRPTARSAGRRPGARPTGACPGGACPGETVPASRLPAPAQSP